MARKKKVSDKQYRRMKSQRQERGPGGQFGGLKPEFRTASPAASESAAPPTQSASPAAPESAAPPTPSAGAGAPNAEAGENIDLLTALGMQQKETGSEPTALEDYVVGTSQKEGVRSKVEAFIVENREKFNREDPAGAAAYQLMREAVLLSEESLSASVDDAQKIYAQLKFIRGIAAKTKGEQSSIANELDAIIKPVEEQLKKRTSFSEFIKDRAKNFKKTLPERLAAKIPVVGGLISQFLKEKRETKEKIDDYAGRLRAKISRGENRGSELDISGTDSREPRNTRTGSPEQMGGTRASDIPGLGINEQGKGGTRVLATLDGMYKEVREIRKLLIKQADVNELAARESELEGAAGSAMGGGNGSAASVLSALGGKGGIAGTAGGGGGGGILSTIGNIAGIGSFVTSGGIGATRRLGTRGLTKLQNTSVYKAVSSPFRRATESVRTAGKSVTDFGRNTAKQISKKGFGKTVVDTGRRARIVGKNAIKAIRNSKAGQAVMSAGRSISNAGKNAIKGITQSRAGQAVMGAGKSVWDAGKNAIKGVSESGAAAGGAGGWFSNMLGRAGNLLGKLNPTKLLQGPIAKGAGKIIKGIAKIPGLGAIITGIMGAIDIASIKNNTELSKEEKKEQIGKTIVKTVGEALGSVAGGALGTLIPIPGLGTLIGTIGGAWVGGKIAELLAEQIGPTKFYDMVAAIPGVGSLISVDGDESSTGEGVDDLSVFDNTYFWDSYPNLKDWAKQGKNADEIKSRANMVASMPRRRRDREEESLENDRVNKFNSEVDASIAAGGKVADPYADDVGAAKNPAEKTAMAGMSPFKDAGWHPMEDGTMVPPETPNIANWIQAGGSATERTIRRQQVRGLSWEKKQEMEQNLAGKSSAAGNDVQGKIVAPATANTTMGKMMSQYSAEQNALSDARSAAATPAGGNTNNNANIQTKISTTNNNFNDDLRIRNNEPTQKQMQAFSMVP